MSEKITFQMIFDRAWQAFIIEDKPPALGAVGNCVYENDQGDCCAIGLSLPANHPSRTRLCSFDELVAEYPELFADEILKANAARLIEFQCNLHDYLVTANTWCCDKAEREQRYREVADAYKLTIPGETNEK